MKNLLILLLLSGCLSSGFAQKAELLPPFGHTTFATDFDIDVESKTIASISLDGKMIFWDIASAKAYKKVNAHSIESYSIRYSWNGNYIVTSSIDNTVRIWDNLGNFKYEVNTGSPNLYAELNRAQTQLAVASFDGHLRVYEFPSLKKLHDITVSKKQLNCAVFSTNGRLVFTGDDEGGLNAYDVENSGKNMLNLNLSTPVKMVSFDYAGSAMVVHMMNGMAEVYLLPSFQSLGRLPIPVMNYEMSSALKFASNIDISPDSKWLAMANSDGQIQIISGETLVAAAASGEKFETTVLPMGHENFIGKVKFSPDMRYLVSLGHDKKFTVAEIYGVDLQNTKDQFVSIKIVKQYSDYIRSVYFDDDFNIHLRGFYTYTWDLKTGEYYTEWISDTRDKFLRDELEKYSFNKADFYVDEKRDIILVDDKGKLDDPDYIVWSKDRKRAVFTYSNTVYDLDITQKKINGTYKQPWTQLKPETAALSSAGDLVYSEEKKLIAIDNQGEKLWSKKLDYAVNQMEISLDGRKLVLGTFQTELNVFGVSDGKLIQSIKVDEAEAQVVCFMPDNDGVLFSGYYGGIRYASVTDGTKKVLVENDDYSIFGMATSKDGKMLATVNYDRLVTLYSVEQKKAMFDMFPMQDYGLAIVNEDNYYMSDKKAYKELAFYYNNKIYTGDQFDAFYNRPDLVLKSSPYADKNYVDLFTDTWRKRMKKLGIKSDGLNESFTDVTLKNSNEIKTYTKDNKVKLSINIHDTVNKVTKLRVTINDVPLNGLYDFSVTHLPASKNTDVEINVPLLAQKNIIKITAIDEHGVVSLPEVVEVTSENTEKSDLYLVTIGTSVYKDERFNLNYAAKDANDIKELFSSAKDFNKIHTLVLTDGKVKANSLDEVRKFLKSSKPNDIVLVFVAGHGVLDAELNYYLASNETNFLNPSEGGIKYEELEKMFAEIPAIRKSLLLDACHSGEFDKDEVAMNASQQTTKNEKVKFRSSGAGVITSENAAQTSLLVKELFADMRSGSGATILSSAGGAEYAIESSEYKNGLFTYSLINGIKTAGADLNGDGSIMLSELQQYICASVLKLSGGEQRPTSRVENLSMDFKIW